MAAGRPVRDAGGRLNLEQQQHLHLWSETVTLRMHCGTQQASLAGKYYLAQGDILDTNIDININRGKFWGKCSYRL